MKYFAIIFLSFVLIHPAYAAKQVSGSVPVVQPLQPPAAGISSNVSHNIQEQSPLNNEALGQAPQAMPTSSEQNPQAQNQTQSVPPAVAPYKKSSPWIWWLVILAVFGLFAFWLKRKGPTA